MLDYLNELVDKHKFLVAIFITAFSGFGGWFIKGTNSVELDTQQHFTKIVLEKEKITTNGSKDSLDVSTGESLKYSRDKNGKVKVTRLFAEYKGKKPFLVKANFDLSSTVCLPDPYVVFEQVLLWEIDYLEFYVYDIPVAQKFLIEKSEALKILRKMCLEKHNIR